MQTYLKGLTALHSADMQANDTRALGRTVRRDPVTTEHPLIRTHPVTGWNALFFNPGFVTKIVGVPKTESDAIIRYLTEVIATTQEIHVRFQWGKNDVAFWDNRSTVSLAHLHADWRFSDIPRFIPLPTDSLLTVVMQCVWLFRLSGRTSTLRGSHKKRSSLRCTTYRQWTRTEHGSPTIMTNVRL